MNSALPYHQLMSPDWIDSNTNINGPHTFFPKYLEIKPTSPSSNRALNINVLPPGVLSSKDTYSVTLTIAMDPTLPVSATASGLGAIFGISDGNAFIGSMIVHADNYATYPPCRQLEGLSSSNGGPLSNIQDINSGSSSTSTGPLVTLPMQQFSSEIKLQFRPNEKWGSCTTGHDAGYVNIAKYNNKLDPSTNGLFLEFYRSDDTGETYQIKYIVVDVDLD